MSLILRRKSFSGASDTFYPRKTSMGTVVESLSFKFCLTSHFYPLAFYLHGYHRVNMCSVSASLCFKKYSSLLLFVNVFYPVVKSAVLAYTFWGTCISVLPYTVHYIPERNIALHTSKELNYPTAVGVGELVDSRTHRSPLLPQTAPPGRCDVSQREDLHTSCTSWAACAASTCPHGFSSVGTTNCRYVPGYKATAL